ncbi:MAG: phage terminase large subunit family protein [Sulfuricurvum sp.]
MSNVYVPSDESLKFISFVRAASVEDNANATIHYKLADKYFSDDKQVLIEAFRGSAKSTMMEWLVIYVAALGMLPGFGTVEFIAFIGDSAENGVKNFFRNVVGKIDRSEFLKQLITIQRKTDGELEMSNTDGVELNLKGYGAGTNIRGVRYKGARPDIVILDDITTNDAMSSEAIQSTINHNFYKSVIPALHPTRFKIFFIGTPISERDLLHQLSSNPEWVVHKFPICTKFPCSKEEFEGNWTDRFPYEAVKGKYDMYLASGQAQSFYQEYMLEITDLTTLLVDEDDIKWFDPTVVSKNKDSYNFYIATDFATSTKKSADYSAITVWAINNNNDWMLVDGQAKRQTMQENIEDVFKYVSKWKPLSVGIETSGQQGGFLSIIEEEMMRKNTWFTLAKKTGSKEPGIRPSKDKVHRFVTGVQPKFKQRKVWLPKPDITSRMNPTLFSAVEELVHELSRFTLAGGVKALQHDDMLDTLNQLSEMEKFTPNTENPKDFFEDHNKSHIWSDFDEEESTYAGNGSTVF